MTPSDDAPVHNVPLDPYQRLLRHAKAQRRLLSVHWELTHRCNERCIHCYLDVLPPRARPVDELTTAECIAVLDQLAALGALHLTLSGGELFVRRDWYALATAAHARRFVLRIFTNGLAITPARAAQLAALQPYAVEISVYGADAATHDAVTQLPGSFARTRRAFGLLATHGLRTILKTPLLASNIAQFDALRSLAAELHAGFRCDPLLTPKRSGDDAPLRSAPRYADLVTHYRRTLDAAPPTTAPGCRLCNVGHNALAIAPNGDIYPCLELPIAVGNVRHTSLAELWAQAPRWETLTSLRAETLAACRDCALGALCGRCHGLARQATGNLHAPSPLNCTQALARRQALIERKLASPESLPLNAHLATLHRRLESDATRLPA